LLAAPADIVIDGGKTSHYPATDIRRQRNDVADSGPARSSTSLWARERRLLPASIAGTSLMIGTPMPRPVQHLSTAVRQHAGKPGAGEHPDTPAAGLPAPVRPDQGYLHCGRSRRGHFVKMVHNGIEYGVMAAYAEG
jgi:6-phosphogluconate dehydrogenase